MKYRVYVWGDEGEVVVYVEANSERRACEIASDIIEIYAEPDDYDDEDAD